MKIRALALAALLAVAASEAQAATMWMCAPDIAAAAAARRVVNPNTNNAYQLNGAGCGLIQQADIGYFSTQGFTQGSPYQAIVYNTGVGPAGAANFVIGTLPAKSVIQQIVVSNITGNAVTGLAVGSTANGVDIVAAATLAANTDRVATIVAAIPSNGAAVTLNLSGTTWNSANVNITVIYGAY